MGIKLSILAILFSFLIFSQETEEQRKYILTEELNFNQFQAKIENMNGLSTFFHSNFTYYDLYLDSPNFDLYKQGYSLRFRKRIINDSTSSYSFQLKSEMLEEKQIRIEIEETELDFYKIYVGENWISLSEILHHIFFQFEKNDSLYANDSLKQDLELISTWISQKAGGPIAPFQKLKALQKELFSDQLIGSIRPVLIGKSKRIRGHVYLNPELENSKLKHLQRNKIPSNEIPLFFKTNPKFNYLLECSYDQSHFYFLNSKSNLITLTEFEVENKYKDREKGSELLDLYENELFSTMAIKVELASKYKQSMLHYFLNH